MEQQCAPCGGESAWNGGDRRNGVPALCAKDRQRTPHVRRRRDEDHVLDAVRTEHRRDDHGFVVRVLRRCFDEDPRVRHAEAHERVVHVRAARLGRVVGVGAAAQEMTRSGEIRQ